MSAGILALFVAAGRLKRFPVAEVILAALASLRRLGLAAAVRIPATDDRAIVAERATEPAAVGWCRVPEPASNDAGLADCMQMTQKLRSQLPHVSLLHASRS